MRGHVMPGTKRHIDTANKAVTIEFSNGSTFGPIELNPTTDALTRMIGVLEGRVASLEEKSK
jgi:hypothetical protein